MTAAWLVSGLSLLQIFATSTSRDIAIDNVLINPSSSLNLINAFAFLAGICILPIIGLCFAFYGQRRKHPQAMAVAVFSLVVIILLILKSFIPVSPLDIG